MYFYAGILFKDEKEARIYYDKFIAPDLRSYDYYVDQYYEDTTGKSFSDFEKLSKTEKEDWKKQLIEQCWHLWITGSFNNDIFAVQRANPWKGDKWK